MTESGDTESGDTDQLALATRIVEQFMAAEASNDVAAHDGLMATSFRGVGPLGFVLTREQWLDRLAPGQLVYQALAWSEPDVRLFGDAAIVIGVVDQRATYQGQDSNGRFRATVVVVGLNGTAVIAGLHLSPILPPPGR